MLKRALQAIARNLAFRRKLPPKFGSRSIFVSPDSALSYGKLNWTQSFASLFDAVTKYVREDDNVWDIGANVGAFALAAAHRAGPNAEVLAIEADPFLASLVQKTITYPGNSDRKIKVVCAAVSNTDGVACFRIATLGRSSNSLAQCGHRSTAGGTRYEQYVPTVKLDSLLSYFAPPSVVKIDVEGAEELVLSGAERVLEHIRPIIYIEVGGDRSPAVTSLFKKFDYQLFDGDGSDRQVLESCPFNTLAVPIEMPLTNAGYKSQAQN